MQKVTEKKYRSKRKMVVLTNDAITTLMKLRENLDIIFKKCLKKLK